MADNDTPQTPVMGAELGAGSPPEPQAPAADDSPITRQDLSQAFEDILTRRVAAPVDTPPPPSRAEELADDPVATVQEMRRVETRMMKAIRDKYPNMPASFYEGLRDQFGGVSSLHDLEDVERNGAHLTVARSSAMDLVEKGEYVPPAMRKQLGGQPAPVAPPEDRGGAAKNHPAVQAEIDQYKAVGIEFTPDQIARANKLAAAGKFV